MLKRSYLRKDLWHLGAGQIFCLMIFPLENFGIAAPSSDQGSCELRVRVAWVRPHFLEIFVYDLGNLLEGRLEQSWQGSMGRQWNWRIVWSELREAKLTPALHTGHHPECLVFISTDTVRTCIYIDYEEMIGQEEVFDKDLEIGPCEGSETVGWIFFSVGGLLYPLPWRRVRIISFSQSPCNMQQFLI